MKHNNTISQAMQQGKQYLKENGIDTYALDSQLLLQYATGLKRVQLFTHDSQVLTDAEQALWEDSLHQRAMGKPLQYITGHCEFMGLDFLVDSSTLIPRGDTEVLVEAVLEYQKKENLHTILDMGTGSGCIPISLVHYANMKAYGVDISAEALAVAQKNAQRNCANVTWIQSDLFSNVPTHLHGTLDALLSNPPYIPTKDIEGLMREVKHFEPYTALDGGEDGLDFYRKIIRDGSVFLRNKGWIFFEIGYHQGKEVSDLLQQAGFIDIEVRKDLAGLDRVVLARKYMNEVE